MSFWVYILKCSDGSYYTGHTDHLERRMAQHRSRAFPSCFTASRLPVELAFVQEMRTREEAIAAERQIKGWSRKKKEAMMRGDWSEVSRLARNALRPLDPSTSSGLAAQGARDNAVAEHPTDDATAPVKP
jgi:predicted GIY-YIG superfamily endonuclease